MGPILFNPNDGSPKVTTKCEVVVAQLVEQLLPIPEVCSSNPVIG